MKILRNIEAELKKCVSYIKKRVIDVCMIGNRVCPARSGTVYMRRKP